MSRYIDAEKIKYTEYINGDVTVSKDLVEKIPTADVVEVVLCKDCQYFDRKDLMCERCGDIDEPCGGCHYYGSCTYDDGYCHHGERRKEDGDA